VFSKASTVVDGWVIVNFVDVDPRGGFEIVKDGLYAFADQSGNLGFVQVRECGTLQA
jgi:hypothetical protein